VSSAAVQNSRWPGYALAGAGGVLYFLGWAGFGIWPLAFVCLVPLWAALERGLARHAANSFLLGWFYGTVMFAGGYHWLISFLEIFSGYGKAPSVLFWLIFSAYLGGQYALYALLYRVLRVRGWPVHWAALPPVLLVEWLYPLLFPSYLATSFYRQTHFIQVADLGGPLLVSAVVVLVNLAVFEGWRWLSKERSAPWVLWAITASSVALTLGYGILQISRVTARMEDAPALRLGIVQVNMGVFEKREDAKEGHRRHLEQTRELESEADFDLIVWPESAYVGRLSRELPFSGAPVRRGLKSPILFGAVSGSLRDPDRKIYNTAFLMDEDGQVRASYDKTFLLAFGEYLPFGETFPVLYELSPNSGHFSKGDHLRPLQLGPWRISTPICYEDILPRFTRHMVLEGNPHILINLTNDSWFGDTQEPWIHLAMAQFRAVEHRRYLVRSTNSGVSAVVDPLGRVVTHTGVQTRENLRADVRMLDDDTVYTRWGDWPGWLSMLSILFMFIRRPKQAR
jgi:apolipoprotein N-acyltransferase